MIRVLYFAWVRERVGVEEEVFALDAPMRLSELVARLAGKSAGHAEAFAEPERLRAAVNQDFASYETFVQPGDEVAIFPPVTGG